MSLGSRRNSRTAAATMAARFFRASERGLRLFAPAGLPVTRRPLPRPSALRPPLAAPWRLSRSPAAEGGLAGLVGQPCRLPLNAVSRCVGHRHFMIVSPSECGRLPCGLGAFMRVSRKAPHATTARRQADRWHRMTDAYDRHLGARERGWLRSTTLVQRSPRSSPPSAPSAIGSRLRSASAARARSLPKATDQRGGSGGRWRAARPLRRPGSG